MSTYNNSIGHQVDQYAYDDLSAPTSHYNRDDEYSRRAAAMSYDCQVLVNDVMADRAQTSRLYQSEASGNGMLESDLTATHMRPSEMDQQYTSMGQIASMDLIDSSREVQNPEFEDITSIGEMEEPESSRNGAIQGSVERMRERATCETSVIYNDVGGIVTPTEVQLNQACIPDRFGGRERAGGGPSAVSLRLRVPTLSGPTERMREREQVRDSLRFDTVTDRFGGGGREYESTPASMESDYIRGNISADLSKGPHESAENALDKDMMDGVIERAGGHRERAGTIAAVNNSSTVFELDRFESPQERFNASYFRSRMGGSTSGVSRFNSDGEAIGICNCGQPGCPHCERFYDTGGTSAQYKGPARFTNSGEAFY
jgi:hypothetical protein